jgi:hypothetical protein
MQKTHKICCVGALLLLLYAGLLSWKSIAGFPVVLATHQHWPWLGSKPFGEDGFYLLTVANYLGTTHHLVYNYGRAATGIQPLITFVFAAIAWAVNVFHGDRWMLIRVLLVFNSALFVLFAWQMAWIAEQFAPPGRRNLVFLFGFFLVLCDYTLFRLFNYGLETGIYLLLISCAYRITLRMTRAGAATWSQVIGLGVISGLAGLARIDFGVILAIVFCFLLLRRVMTLMQTVACGFVALIIASPWFLFVHSAIGSWMPSSGQTESERITFAQLYRFGYMADSLMSNIAPWVYRFFSNYSIGTLFGCASCACLAYLLYRSPETRARPTGPGGYLFLTGPWLTAFLVLTLVYTLSFRVVSFYTRYTSPMVIITVPLAALILAEQKVFSTRPVVVILVLAGIFLGYDLPSLHSGNVGPSFLVTAGYVRQYYPNAHVAGFQTGTVGYFNSNVDNLDGKLNVDALHAREEHRLDKYIDQQGYSVLVDWTSYFDSLPADYLQREWMPCPHPMHTSESSCLIRKTAQ